jgi:hypothetical protein
MIIALTAEKNKRAMGEKEAGKRSGGEILR